MKHMFTRFCWLLMVAVIVQANANAQFYKYLPGISNYLRGDVTAEMNGLTFTYTWQDTSLGIGTLVMHTDNSGQPLTVLKAGSNFGSFTAVPVDTSVIVTGYKTLSSGNRVGLIQKLDKNGNILWKKSIAVSSADAGVGNVMIGPGSIIYATVARASFSSNTYYSRNSVIAMDQTGTLLWSKFYANPSFTTDYSFTRAMVASNGDFIAVADIRGSVNAQANGMMVTRISPAGAIIFSKYIDFKDTHNQLSVAGLVETASGNLIFGGRLMTDQISTYTNTMWLGKMDGSGNMLQQKVYTGGANVGEQLHGMQYANGKVYAYLLYYAPFDSVTRAIWVGELDEASMLFTAQNATAVEVSAEDPYGNVRNAFCISSDGKPTAAGDIYCAATNQYLPIMQQWSASLMSDCTALDKVLPITDSAANYPVTNYTSQSSFSFTIATDTTVIQLTTLTGVAPAGLCNGCSSVAPPPQQVASHTGKDGYRLYPNPGDGFFRLQFLQPVVNGRATVYNTNGVMIFDASINGTDARIDLTNQAQGIYYLRVGTQDGKAYFSKLAKDK